MTEQDMVDALVREGWVLDENGCVNKGEHKDMEPRDAYLIEFGPDSLDSED